MHNIPSINLRSTFSPIFTSGKLKLMMQFIANVSQDLANEFSKAAEKGATIDMKEVMSKYSMDTIASCAFGVNAESFSNENSKFAENARQVFRYISFKKYNRDCKSCKKKNFFLPFQ